MKLKMGLSEWSMLILLSILWGGSFLFVGIAVADIPPLTIVLLRVSISALCLHLILKLLKLEFPFYREAIGAFLVMGLLNNAIPFSLIVWGQTHIASGLASILNATTPIFTVIIAHFLTQDEKLNTHTVIGIIVGFSGVAIMIGIDALSQFGAHIWAQIAILAATLSYAFAAIYGRKFKKLGITPICVATGQVSASTFILLPFVFWIEQPWTLTMISLNSIYAVLALAVLSTVFAYILFFKILERAGATNLLLVTFIIPPSAILFGVIILNERIELIQIFGMIIIAFGLLMIDGRVINAFFKRKS